MPTMNIKILDKQCLQALIDAVNSEISLLYDRFDQIEDVQDAIEDSYTELEELELQLQLA
jgi:hypothetical protein